MRPGAAHQICNQQHVYLQCVSARKSWTVRCLSQKNSTAGSFQAGWIKTFPLFMKVKHVGSKAEREGVGVKQTSWYDNMPQRKRREAGETAEDEHTSNVFEVQAVVRLPVESENYQTPV